MKEPVILKFESKEGAYQAIASALESAAINGITKRKHANIALSGGSTPEPAYVDFAKRNLDWSNVSIALVDDRWVDNDNEGSNEAMLHRAFESAKGVKIIGMKNNAATPEEGCEILEPIYKNMRPFDAIILGMGNDAHTASWFSGANHLEDILRNDCAQTIAAIDASHSVVGGKYPQRMTLTLPPIAESEMVILLIFGQEKLKVFEQSVTGDARSAPIKAAIDAASCGLMVFWAP